MRVEGACAVVLGIVLVVEAIAFGRWDAAGWVLPGVAVVASALAVVGARAATASAIRRAAATPPRMREAAVRRQTVLETVAWAVSVGVFIVTTGDSAELVAGTGIATVAFGIARMRAAVPAAARVDRRRYVAGLAHVLNPGGRLFLQCFSDAEPAGQGPRRITRDELHTAFATGWTIESIEPVHFELNPKFIGATFSPGGPKSWFATIRGL